MDESICPFCKSTNILFHLDRWHCLECNDNWEKFEEGMEFKIGINCKWLKDKKFRLDWPEQFNHGFGWCYRPSNFPMATQKPFTCRCKEFETILSDCVDCSEFWVWISLYDRVCINCKSHIKYCEGFKQDTIRGCEDFRYEVWQDWMLDEEVEN